MYKMAFFWYPIGVVYNLTAVEKQVFMREEINNIEIKEPPIQKLNKERSCLKKSCTTGCGCIVLIVIISLLILKFIAVPRPKELKSIPSYFPEIIPLYDEQDIEKITYTSGKQKNKILELTAYLPKIILVPIYLSINEYLPPEIKSDLEDMKDKTGWEKFVYLMQRPITDKKDIIEIEWKKLSADPEFIYEYYQTELKKQKFDTDIISQTKSTKQMSFIKYDIHGVLYINDDPDKKGTDLTILTISMSSFDNE